MALAERSAGFYSETVGSEKFEDITRKPLVIAVAALSAVIGPGAAIEMINQIGKRDFATATIVASRGLLKVGVTSAIGIASIASGRRSRQSPETQSLKL